MDTRKTFIAIGLVIASLFFYEIAAHADMSDQSVKLTFSEPIQIPGQTLPAGTYVFQLANSDAGRNLVQVFNSDRSVLYATLQAVPTERPDPTDDTSVELAQTEPGKPIVLLKWFYPGQETGSEFIYPKRVERELAKGTQRTIAARPQTVLTSGNSGVGN